MADPIHTAIYFTFMLFASTLVQMTWIEISTKPIPRPFRNMSSFVQGDLIH
jgi:hypothetical protein